MSISLLFLPGTGGTQSRGEGSHETEAITPVSGYATWEKKGESGDSSFLNELPGLDTN